MKQSVRSFGSSGVQLRLLDESDLERTLAWRNSDDARVWFKMSDPLTFEQHRTWFQRYLEKEDDYVFIVETAGVPVGQASVYGIDLQRGVAEVGRFLAAPEARGKGFMSAACGELLQFCANTLGLKSVYLEVKQDNQRAIRMYTRHGFVGHETTGAIMRMTRSVSPPS